MAVICPNCRDARLVRRRRSLLERIFHAAVYFCPKCGVEAPVSQVAVYPHMSITARCPRCSNTHLRRLKKRDQIEKLYQNPVSRFQQWIGAPLLYCRYCRLQFYDFRRCRDRETGD